MFVFPFFLSLPMTFTTLEASDTKTERIQGLMATRAHPSLSICTTIVSVASDRGGEVRTRSAAQHLSTHEDRQILKDQKNWYIPVDELKGVKAQSQSFLRLLKLPQHTGNILRKHRKGLKESSPVPRLQPAGFPPLSQPLKHPGPSQGQTRGSY